MSEKNLAENTKPKEARLMMPSKGLARWATIRATLQSLAKQVGFRLEIDGAESVEQTSDGLRFKLLPGGGPDHPFKGVVKDGLLTILGGYANHILLDEVPIDEASGIAYITLTFTLDIEDGFVYSAILTDAELAYDTTLPADDGSSGIFYLALFTFDGTAIIQSVTQNLRVKACDDGSGEGVAELYIIQS